MKITKENYKEIIDEMSKINTMINESDKQVYYYHNSYLSYTLLESVNDKSID